MMESGYTLKIDKDQRIVLLPGTRVCMLRNKNLIAGNDRSVFRNNPDTNIVVDGGIWDALNYSYAITNSGGFASDAENPIKGATAMMLFSNVEDVIIKNITFINSTIFAVKISNAEGLYISDIVFENYHKDGIHVNGPTSYGIIRNLTGENMGDDMVAFNAWDWETSAMTFGCIEYVLAENLKSTHNEFRLLPGRKTYADKTSTECPINNCIIRNVEGVYTFKLYGQPNCNKLEDCSEIMGNIENFYFDNIKFPEVTDKGLGNIPVSALFEVCADTNNIHLDNILIDNTADEFKATGVNLVNSGPLSATWKKGNSQNPDDWTELFYPDATCEMNNTYIGEVTFTDKVAENCEKKDLLHEVQMIVNEDYPNTTPKGGTGHGIINDVIFEKINK